MNRIIIRALRLGSLVEKNDLPAFDTDGNTENIKKTAAFLCTVFEDCLCVLKFLHRQKCLFECSQSRSSFPAPSKPELPEKMYQAPASLSP